jgi:hypothetical protein
MKFIIFCVIVFLVAAWVAIWQGARKLDANFDEIEQRLQALEATCEPK